MEFNDEIHSDLFKLFILASNGWWLDIIDKIERDRLIYTWYPFQFSDRSYHQEELEGYVSDSCFHLFDREGSDKTKYLTGRKDPILNVKIKFRFEE